MRDQTLIRMVHLVDGQQAALTRVVLPGLRDVTQNEAITRRRVTTAEDRLDDLDHWLQCAGVFGRLRWLLTGKVDIDERGGAASAAITRGAPGGGVGTEPTAPRGADAPRGGVPSTGGGAGARPVTH